MPIQGAVVSQVPAALARPSSNFTSGEVPTHDPEKHKGRGPGLCLIHRFRPQRAKQQASFSQHTRSRPGLRPAQPAAQQNETALYASHSGTPRGRVDGRVVPPRQPFYIEFGYMGPLHARRVGRTAGSAPASTVATGWAVTRSASGGRRRAQQPTKTEPTKTGPPSSERGGQHGPRARARVAAHYYYVIGEDDFTMMLRAS